MTVADLDAIKILGRLQMELTLYDDPNHFEHWQALKTLVNAIRHLAYPDRDIYPKTRKGTKGAPIVRR